MKLNIKEIVKTPLFSEGCLNTVWVYTLILVAFISGVTGPYLNETTDYAPVGEPKEAWIQIAALAITAGISIYKGIKQNKAARDLAKTNQRPNRQVSQGTKNNLALAKVAANEGLPEQVYSNTLNQLQLNTSTALRNNLLYGRGGANTNSIVRAANEGVNQLNAEDAAARARNRQVLMQANSQLAEEESQIFNTQQRQFEQQADLVAGLRSASDQNIYGAVNTVLGGVASGALNTGGASTSATASGVSPSANMRLSERGITAGLQQDYNRTVNNALRAPTIAADPNFWRNAGIAR